MGDLAAPSAAQGVGVSRRIATNTRGMGGTGGGSSLGTAILVPRAERSEARTPVLLRVFGLAVGQTFTLLVESSTCTYQY